MYCKENGIQRNKSNIVLPGTKDRLLQYYAEMSTYKVSPDQALVHTQASDIPSMTGIILTTLGVVILAALIVIHAITIIAIGFIVTIIFMLFNIWI